MKLTHIMLPVLFFLTGVIVGATGSFIVSVGCVTAVHTMNNTYNERDENSDDEEDDRVKVNDMITKINTVINKESSLRSIVDDKDNITRRIVVKNEILPYSPMVSQGVWRRTQTCH